MPRASLRFLHAVAALAAVFTVLGSAAQVLYKWTDASGKIVYSDRPPPKGYAGKVERIDASDPPANPAPAPAATPRELSPPRTPDIAARRRETREALAARVDAARAKVEAARTALAEGADIAVEDRRTFVKRVDGPPQQALAMSSNCRIAKDANGKEVAVCATSIPNDAYNDRVAKLEEALRVAEDDLDQALTAYRRGVD